MAYETKPDLSSDVTYALGGNAKNGKANPTQIEGYFIGSRVTKDTGYGPGLLHFFETKRGVEGIWGKTRLNNLLTEELKGMKCLVTFTGMSEAAKGKRPAYKYQVKFDKGDRKDVSGIDISEQGQEPDSGDDSAYVTPDASYSDQGLDTQAEEQDVIVPQRPKPPATRAAAPDAARQARVQALLNGSRPKAS